MPRPFRRRTQEPLECVGRFRSHERPPPGWLPRTQLCEAAQSGRLRQWLRWLHPFLPWAAWHGQHHLQASTSAAWVSRSGSGGSACSTAISPQIATGPQHWQVDVLCRLQHVRRDRAPPRRGRYRQDRSRAKAPRLEEQSCCPGDCSTGCVRQPRLIRTGMTLGDLPTAPPVLSPHRQRSRARPPQPRCRCQVRRQRFRPQPSSPGDDPRACGSRRPRRAAGTPRCNL